MAATTGNTLIGAATVSIGIWVTAGGAGSLTDLGHTSGPTTLTPSFENHDTVSERAFGILKSSKLSMDVQLVVPIMEMTPDNLAIALAQAPGNVSGTPPALTLLVGDPADQYHQITIVGPGLGATSTRTITIWRAQVISVGEIAFTKTGDQILPVTFRCLYDDTLATADKFLKVVDS